jgi:hypothetical protein
MLRGFIAQHRLALRLAKPLAWRVKITEESTVVGKGVEGSQAVRGRNPPSQASKLDALMRPG